MEWIRGDPIGHGSFATVNLAIPTTPNNQLMAVKSCSVSHSASLINEKLILNQLNDCPNIINCLGDCFSMEKGVKLYNLILEYANGGSISDKLKSTESRRLPEFDIRRYTYSILKALKFIHENGFVHCDIKLQNVLLFQIAGEEVAKIADFGLAKLAGERGSDSRSEMRGTPLYMSPEMVTGGEQESPADIWALGCVVAEMVTGDPAWRCHKDADLFGLLMKIGSGQEMPEIPGKLSDEGKDFLGKCFVKDPKMRWTAEMLLNHPFVSNLGKDQFIFTSTSPKSAFDFPYCLAARSSVTSSMTSSMMLSSLPESELWFGSENESPAARLNELGTDRRQVDWFVSDDWITVR